MADVTRGLHRMYGDRDDWALADRVAPVIADIMKLVGGALAGYTVLRQRA